MRVGNGLVKHIREILRRADLGPAAAVVFFEAFPRRPMRGLITVERDLLRQPTLSLKRPPKERFGRRDIPLGPQQEVDRRAGLIDGPIQIFPAAFDLT